MYDWSVAGFPAIGVKRELKFALEKFWRNEISEDELHIVAKSVRSFWYDVNRSQNCKEFPVGEFSFYDRMLDMTALFGLLPERFSKLELSPLNQYFAAARGYGNGKSAVKPLAMKKWFNTNYHYLVPELDSSLDANLNAERLLALLTEAREEKVNSRAVIIGPLTFVALSRVVGDEIDWVNTLLPLYNELFALLAESGVEKVQIDEPILVTENSPFSQEQISSTYETLSSSPISIFLNTYFESITEYETVVNLPVDSIGIDFVESEQSIIDLETKGFPSDKSLVAGVVSGRSIWACSPEKLESLLNRVESVVGKEKVCLSSSCSLLHLPYTVENESFESEFQSGLSFAKEKCTELQILASNDTKGLALLQSKYDAFLTYEGRSVPAVRKAVADQDSQKRGRSLPFDDRITQQERRLNLPALPTTTIGSFPQSNLVRKTRRLWRKGELSNDEYETFIENEIRDCLKVQEQIGLDVLVHGEFERTDMVEFFGEKLEGFRFSQFGWVQSYGSRCVKPPLLFGDVSRTESITVKETAFANSCTEREVKGMLTGPITILNWSFVRDDLSYYEVAKQVALAIGDEVLDLEANGIAIVQVDEAALREGVPLKSKAADEYLENAVDLFKRTVERVKDDTQIHTHMCYSEFSDIGESIIDFDADVITVESTRDGETLADTFGGGAYPNHIGPGIYDIHSTIIPSTEQFEERISTLKKAFDPKQLWVNPDCGLKTRDWKQVIPALTNMVNAVKAHR